MNNDKLRTWYLTLADTDKLVFLALVSSDLTIHGRDFGRYAAGAEQNKAFKAFQGLNELQHQISGHIAAMLLKHVRHSDDGLWKILEEQAATYGLTAHLGRSLDFARSRNVWGQSTAVQ